MPRTDAFWKRSREIIYLFMWDMCSTFLHWFFERQKNWASIFYTPEKRKCESVNTALRQAQKEVCRLKRNSSDYGMTEIFFYIDFSRSPTETENLTGYSLYCSALEESGGDAEQACRLSGLSSNSIVTEPIIEEPFLLGTAKVTKTQEKFLLCK